MKPYLLPIFALLIVGWRKRTDFDKGAYNRPFEKVGPILSNDDRNRNKTNVEENQCWDSAAQKRLIEKTKKEDGKLVVVRDGKVVRIKARDLK